MAQRRKYTTEFVQNDKDRLATFQRRSRCLLKKASELSTLCDVDVAVLIYADHLSDRPLVFPPESGESLRIIKKLKENPRCVPAVKSKPDKFLNQANRSKGPNNKFCDDITSLNVDELNSLVRILDAKEAEVLRKIDAIKQRKNEAAVDKVSDPNRFLFCGDDHHSELFDHQPHGFQGPISFSVMGNEDTDESKSEQLIENNYGFLNQISGHLNNNNYNDEITSLNVGEESVEETSDPNCFFFCGVDRQSALFDHQQRGFQWPVSFSVRGKDNTSESKSEHLTEKNSGLCNLITGHPNNIYYDELMSLHVGELDLARIMDAMEEDEIDTIGEKSNLMPNCWNFPGSITNDFSDPNCFFFNGDGRPTPSVSENTKVFDYQPHDFQTASSSSSSSGAMLIPCSCKVEDDTPVSEPHHLTENSSWFLDHVVPILDVEPEEAIDEIKIINEKTIETTNCESFSKSNDCESLAPIFYDELPGTNCLSLNSENPMMYHQFESLDYQPFGFQPLIPFS